MNNKGFIATVNQQSKEWLTSHKICLLFKLKQGKTWVHQQYQHRYQGYCLCCKQQSGRHLDLCLACENSLLRLGNSCMQCAESITSSTKEPHSTPPLCGNCIITPPSYSKTHALWHYRFPTDQLIKNYKYQQKAAIGKTLSKIYSQHLDNIGATADIITCVPMHWQRRNRCDFNHSEQLAAMIGKQLNISVDNKLLIKTKANPKQHSLNKQQRQRNLKNSFAVNKPELIQGKTLAIVDDVMTTGSTAEAISKVLIKTGAKAVHIWSLARVTKSCNPE